MLYFLYHLKYVKLQVIGGVIGPQDRVIAGLGAEFDLAQAFVSSAGGFRDRFREQFLIHEMRAGAGREEPSVPDKAHAADVDLAVSFDGIFDGIA